MKVELIAHTIISNHEAMREAGYSFNTEFIKNDIDPQDAAELAEFAGRACYQSWNRPNPETATNEKYINNIIEKAHFSVIEHGTATFLFSEISRNCTHELVRHRHFSFSQKSQRYVNESSSKVIIPKALQSLWDDDPKFAYEVASAVLNVQRLYGETVERLKEKGITGKKARQAARFMLPGGIETMIVVSGNHRSWREFIQKRCIPGPEIVDPEINELATRVLIALYEQEPNIYRDLYREADFADLDLSYE